MKKVIQAVSHKTGGVMKAAFWGGGIVLRLSAAPGRSIVTEKSPPERIFEKAERWGGVVSSEE